MNTFQVTALVNDIEKTFACADDQYILDAAEEAGVDLPYSCRAVLAPPVRVRFCPERLIRPIKVF